MKLKYGHIYWADLGVARGTEPGKLRPVVVIQTDLLNSWNHRSAVTLLCTSQVKGESMIRTSLPINAAGNRVETEILIDQFRTIDARYFAREMGAVPGIIMTDVKRKLALVLNLDLKL